MSRKWKRTAVFLLITLFVGLAVLFAFTDLAISRRAVNEDNLFGRIMEVGGLLVCPWLAALSGLVLSVYFCKERRAALRGLKITAGLLFALGGAAYSAYVYSQTPPAVCTALALLSAAGYLLCGIWLSRRTAAQLYRLSRAAVITAAYIAVSLVAVEALKLSWGRVRFREMTDPAQYTPWYLPQGYTSHKSFPSGHTVNASSLYVLTLLAPAVKERWKKAVCFAIPIGWILIMAFSRVLVGAHYASDVLFGAALSISVFYLVRHLAGKLKKPDYAA